MFKSMIGDIDHDMAVLAMDKTLYDSGFSVTESEIDSDSEFEAFYEALFSMDGYIDENEGEENDCTVFIFQDAYFKNYVRLALKYGKINGISKAQNFWIKRLDWYIGEKMRAIGDYSYDYDYNIFSAKKAFFKVYIGPDFFQTVEMIQAVSSVLRFTRNSCKMLERQTEKPKAKIIPMDKSKERKKAA